MALTNPLDSLLWRKFFVFTRFAPLGIKFWDAVQNKQVVDGLIVTLRANQANAPAISATRTSSGVFAFQNVPGLRGLEVPHPDVPVPAPSSLPYVLSVQDVQGRFTPFHFTISLPLPYRGVFRANGPETPGFLLFSAPTRPTTPEIGVVRAQLVIDGTGRPAANALLEVEIDGVQWFAIADERGMVAVLLPYPKFQTSGAGAGTLPSAQQWGVKVHCFYRPSSLTLLPGLNAPDLRTIVGQRPADAGARLAARANFRFQDNSTGNEISAALIFGSDLTLATRTTTVGGAEFKTVVVLPSGALPIPGP